MLITILAILCQSFLIDIILCINKTPLFASKIHLIEIHYFETFHLSEYGLVEGSHQHQGNWVVMVYYPLSEKKYWKIPRGVMVIPRKNIGFSSEEPKAPRKKSNIFPRDYHQPRVVLSNTFFQTKGNNNHFFVSDALYTKFETYLDIIMQKRLGDLV